MKNLYINKTVISDSNFSELDFDLQDEFGFNYEEFDDLVEIQKGHGDADAYPIKIDRMIQALMNLKNLGATHVELEYHCDHIGYDITGYEIKLSSNEDIERYIGAKELEEKKKQKKQELLRQLRELEEGPQLDEDEDDLPF